VPLTTTDPQHELFDVLDPLGNPTGQVKPRGNVHRDGDWHRGLHIWVYGIDEANRPFVLFQRRSMSKDTWPGKLDVAVGGHFGAGEALEDVLRETEEEIGLAATAGELIPLGRRFVEDYGADYIDRELNEVFALRCDQPLREYRQHPEEVDGVVAVDLADLIELVQGRLREVAAYEVRRDGTSLSSRVQVTDFAGKRRDYRVAVLDGIQAIMRGEVPEPFLIQP
jgi:isopentenyldiphosphate isomerase